MQKIAFRKVPLKPNERRLWEDTLAVLSWIAPGFVHIIYTMLANTGDDELALFTEDIQTAAATDGWQLIFKPSEYFKLNLMQRVFAVLHEVMHEILNHCWVSFHFHKHGVITLAGKSLPFSPIFSNVVQDLVINATLIAAKLGEFNPKWLYDAKLNADQKDWISLYFELWKQQPPARINPRPKPGQGKPCDDGTPSDLPGTGKGDDPGKDHPAIQGRGERMDEHLEPGTSTGKDAHELPPRNEQQWQQAVNTAMEIQRSQGKLPGALEHFFKTVLRPNVDWAEQVRTEMMRISGSGGYTWKKLDRRLVARGVGAPGITGHQAGLIVEGCDSSGSIFVDKTLLARFIGETAGILEDLNPEEVRFLSCDAAITQEFILTDMDDLRKIGVIKGGGGTDFRPVFDYVDKHGLQPDVLIYLTDGDGTFPKHEPDYPVIWGDISGQPEKYPWGKVVFIPTMKD